MKADAQRPFRRSVQTMAALCAPALLAACASGAAPSAPTREGGLPADPGVLAANGYGAPRLLISRADRNNDQYLDKTELQRLRTFIFERNVRD